MKRRRHPHGGAEQALRHDGRRAIEDWPALLIAYGTGDGAFYTKHVRCRDPYALWLLLKQLVVTTVKWVAKTLLGRKPMSLYYVRGFLSGIRESFKFDVDRRTRMYIDPTVPART